MRPGLLALLFLLLAHVVAFGDTGGSMGGGNWGGGGGGGSYSGGGYSSSSSSNSWSSSSSSSPSSTDWSSSSSNGSSSDSATKVGLITMLSMIVAFVLIALVIHKRHHTPSFDRSYTPPTPAPNVDITVLRIAVDGRARKFVQTELKRIALLADTSTDWGRASMLREVSMLLRRLRDAWVYGGALNYEMRKIEEAKPMFDKAVDDARSRFREEVIRNADGTITRKQASDYAARSDEGEGLILVSMIIAARKELFTIERLSDAGHMRIALEGASQITQDRLVAIEIVWQPAEENDRMSSMELEAKYPYPDLAPFPYALVGKTFCAYCTGPFPAELVCCPHCGAPAPGREAA